MVQFGDSAGLDAAQEAGASRAVRSRQSLGTRRRRPAIEHAGTSESLAAAALWLRVKRSEICELRSTLYPCLEERAVDEKANDCPNRYGQW